MSNKSALALRRRIRRYAGATRSIPVSIVPGSSPPRETGEGYRFETTGGKVIRHPNAYARKGWNNIVYVPSTRCVEVGQDWLRAMGWA